MHDQHWAPAGASRQAGDADLRRQHTGCEAPAAAIWLQAGGDTRRGRHARRRRQPALATLGHARCKQAGGPCAASAASLSPDLRHQLVVRKDVAPGRPVPPAGLQHAHAAQKGAVQHHPSQPRRARGQIAGGPRPHCGSGGVAGRGSAAALAGASTAALRPMLHACACSHPVTPAPAAPKELKRSTSTHLTAHTGPCPPAACPAGSAAGPAPPPRLLASGWRWGCRCCSRTCARERAGGWRGGAGWMWWGGQVGRGERHDSREARGAADGTAT